MQKNKTKIKNPKKNKTEERKEEKRRENIPENRLQTLELKTKKKKVEALGLESRKKMKEQVIMMMGCNMTRESIQKEDINTIKRGGKLRN